MGTVLSIVLGLAAAVIGIVVIAGLVYRRQSLPCPVWLRWCVELDNPFSKTNRAAFIVEHLNVAPGMALLDAGCGPGRVTIPLARATGESGEVLAVDLQSGMLDRTRGKAQAAGFKNIRFLNAGLGQGKIDREHFDRAVLITVLGEIPEPEPAMKELFDALKPGGLLSVTEIILDPHFQRRDRVVRMAEAVGFREKAFFGNGLAYTLHVEKPQNA